MSLPSLLRCPGCDGELTPRDALYLCRTCELEFHAPYGIVDLRSRAGASRSACSVSPGMDASNDPESTAGARPWFHEIRNHIAAAPDRARAFYESAATSRTAWKLLLDLHPAAVVLDVACGTGLIASSVAPLVSRVIALEFASAPLRIARRRLDYFNSGDDVTCVLADANQRLPFATGTFDCAILSGVPDWCPPERMPVRSRARAKAVNQLAELQRLLKAGGQVFWVAEHGWDGVIHQWASLVLAILSRVGYRRIMRDAGYATPRIFAMSGTPSVMDRIVPVGTAPSYWTKPATPLHARVRLHRPAASEYGILSSTADDRLGGLLDRVLAEVRSRVETDRSQPLRLIDLQVSRKDKVILFVNDGTTDFIVRVALNGAALESDRQNERMLRLLADEDRCPDVRPRALHTGRCGRLSYFVETRVPGGALSARVASIDRRTMLSRVQELLESLNPTVRVDAGRSLDGELYQVEVESRIDELRRLVDDPLAIERLRGYFRRRLYGITLCLGFVHGDFSVSNILVDDGDRISGLIDWEGGSDNSLPIIDAINFVESLHRVATGDRVGIAIPRLACRQFASQHDERFLMNQYQRWGIDPIHHPALIYLKWLRHMAYLSRFWLAYDEVEVGRFVTPVVDAILNDC